MKYVEIVDDYKADENENGEDLKLTKSQKSLLFCLGPRGLTLKEASDVLCISLDTANKHMRALKDNLKCKTLAHAVYKSVRYSLLWEYENEITKQDSEEIIQEIENYTTCNDLQLLIVGKIESVVNQLKANIIPSDKLLELSSRLRRANKLQDKVKSNKIFESIENSEINDFLETQLIEERDYDDLNIIGRENEDT